LQNFAWKIFREYILSSKFLASIRAQGSMGDRFIPKNRFHKTVTERKIPDEVIYDVLGRISRGQRRGEVSVATGIVAGTVYNICRRYYLHGDKIVRKEALYE
tara:strand:+ start:83 stop:388 length:306 start_codon:yes stop_codon:yes gene_type:complete